MGIIENKIKDAFALHSKGDFEEFVKALVDAADNVRFAWQRNVLNDAVKKELEGLDSRGERIKCAKLNAAEKDTL